MKSLQCPSCKGELSFEKKLRSEFECEICQAKLKRHGFYSLIPYAPIIAASFWIAGTDISTLVAIGVMGVATLMGIFALSLVPVQSAEFDGGAGKK